MTAPTMPSSQSPAELAAAALRRTAPPPPDAELLPPSLTRNWRRTSLALEQYLCRQYDQHDALMPAELTRLLAELRACRGPE